MLAKPVQCREDQSSTNTLTTCLRLHSKQANLSGSAVLVDVTADVAKRLLVEHCDEHSGGHPFATSGDPRLIQSVAKLARESRVPVEPRVQMGGTRDPFQ